MHEIEIHNTILYNYNVYFVVSFTEKYSELNVEHTATH